jgi:tagaturonate epimerase
MSVMLADQLGEMTGAHVYPRSVTQDGKSTYFLARDGSRRLLGILGEAAGFEGTPRGDIRLCPLTAANAALLRERLLWLHPQPLGLARSAGCGDRLGLATPGHVRAVRQTPGIAPIFAQQSIRENARTGRSPGEVLDDAMWGVFQEGWRAPWGADADHLKTFEDLDACAAAGYTFFTLDPGGHVDASAHEAPLSVLKEKWESLPWEDLETSSVDLQAVYLGRTFRLDGGYSLTFSEESLWRAAGKYGQAIAHVVRMYRRLCSQAQDFDLEVSVDETETPTSPLEHYFIASELRRLKVRWVSMAPRYVGRFEKGVDYLGNLEEFEADLAKQAAVARTLGPYKLGIHSGSDKFSLYPMFARHAGGLVHLKTAGTSYLEALRAIAGVEPGLFREIYQLAFEQYGEDRASYHVSANPDLAPQARRLPDSGLPGVLDQFDAREMLHVTFGSALAKYGGRLKESLQAHEEAYYSALVTHFTRHLHPLVGGAI